MSRMQMGTSEVAQPFWEATKDKILMLQFCKSCKKAHHYPRNFCPHCSSTDLEWKKASGKGTIYAVSVTHKPGLPMMAAMVPYAYALVDLEEGPRMMTNIMGCEDPYEPKVGDAVTVAWDEAAEGRFLPVFELAK